VVPEYRFGDGPVRTLAGFIRVTILVNLFMFGSEQFTEFYSGGAHVSAARYLFFGLHGKHALVPWIWTSFGLNVASALLVHLPQSRTRPAVLSLACVCAFTGVWIEKGMGLIIPGFVPSTLHEIVEYVPSLTEWKITVGIWAFGGMVLVLAIKLALPVLSGRVTVARESLPPAA
jgi:molybdopterin-containing oxidoreductase family membrane subunit